MTIYISITTVSLCRVAVVAFSHNTNRDGIAKHMQWQSNRHINHLLSEMIANRLPSELQYLDPADNAGSFYFILPYMLVKLLLRLFAARALPVVRKILKRDAVVLRRIIHIAADRADILAGALFCAEIELFEDGLGRMVKIHDSLCFQVLVALRCMRAAVDGRVFADEGADTPKENALFRQFLPLLKCRPAFLRKYRLVPFFLFLRIEHRPLPVRFAVIFQLKGVSADKKFRGTDESG